MVAFLPFKGILPVPEYAGQVVTRSFDSYSKEEIKSILNTTDFSFLHVIVPVAEEITRKTLSYEERLKLGKLEFKKLVDKGALSRLKQDAYYIYRQTDKEGRVYTGILGAASVADYDRGLIKKHEETLEYKEVVLKEYLEVIDIHAEPVFLTLPDNPELVQLLQELGAGNPHIRVDVEDKTHEIWIVSDQAEIEKIRSVFEATPAMYIADGHHRCASSSLYGNERKVKNPGHQGNEAYNGFLAAVIPESGVRLYEFSRLVKDLGNHTPESFLQTLSTQFDVEPVEKNDSPPKTVHEFGLYLDGKAYRLRLKENPERESPLDQLDPLIMNRLIFEPLLGIKDLRKDKRVKFIGGKADVSLICKEVDSGKYKAAFLSHPVPFSQFKQIADAGMVMPPKSTWFEPKFPSALVIYPLFD
jgi:uncharacterized protein (DUF1015 family)